MGELERVYGEEVLALNRITPVAPNIDDFEIELVEKVKTKLALGVSSCSAALHPALRVLGFGDNDLVSCSTITFVASANPIIIK